jgi:NAD(P)-dependent dehydrogenase (short-subunit alcohol dehydrogenase family)
MHRLDGKVGIVTGGASGMGRSTSLAFAREGAQVVVADINRAGADAVVAEIATAGGTAVAVTVDISRADDMARLVEVTLERFGRLDILDNNASLLGPAAHAIDKDVVNIDLDAWERIFAVNSTGPFLGCKFAVPAMIESGGGSIINMSSTSSLTGYPVSHAYGATKASVNALTMHVATAYGKQGIRCNAIAAGPVQTPAWGDVGAEQVALLQRHVLTPYIGQPEHIAETVVFLASDESAYITGQVISVDGGYLVHQPTTPELFGHRDTVQNPDHHRATASER